MNNLEPCPFCGSEAKIHKFTHKINGQEYYPKCKGGNGFCLLDSFDRNHNGNKIGFTSKKDAIKVWNKRTRLDKTVQALSDIRAIIWSSVVEDNQVDIDDIYDIIQNTFKEVF